MCKETEYYYKLNIPVEYDFNNKPKSLKINLDSFMGEKIKDIEITIDKEKFVFTAEEIKKIFHYINTHL